MHRLAVALCVASVIVRTVLSQGARFGSFFVCFNGLTEHVLRNIDSFVCCFALDYDASVYCDNLTSCCND